MLDKLHTLLPANVLVIVKKWLLPAAIAAVITAVIVALLWQSNNKWTTLFGSQENLPMSEVVETLSGEGLSYRVAPDSGMILVREGDLPQARMALAAKGIRASSPDGYELMDKEEMLGSSQFVQNVRLRRSMEGELAQSIMALDSVEYARVHLGISETSSFVLSNKPNSTASVILRLKYGRQLSDEQVGAIVSLVANSVPGMKAEQVSVVDQKGGLLSANIAEQLNGRPGLRNSGEMVQQMREQIERNIANLLVPVLGHENFRVSVVPRVDFSQVEETQERFLNEPRVASEQLAQDNTTEQLAVGIPGSLSNRPANAPAQNNAQPQLSTRNQAQRQFNWDRDIRHIKHQGYQVQKLTVAVVLNQNAAVVQGWNAENQTQINALLTKAAGIDSQRGDELSLALLAFSQPDVPEDEITPWWERDSTLLWAERGGIGLLALLVILFGLLPMMRRVARQPAANEALANSVVEPEATPEGDEETPALPGSSFNGDDNLPPQSSGLETKINHLQTLAQSETDRVAEVLKQWISSNERSNRK
ncbi:flagellar basal-body MS-ring/collar protein FliF [Pantoea sp. GM01]|uniref:flagellar basal-body MS-ring/collar protein FliF n=1 Tax=Pantoea sp. GM01 TaxID=1144320 RepID=UPI0002710F22|nr:flagellar basal-body MS-ring/collar protein FliF [Pantoea sp. GM01]EJL87142.1 flagellar basal-body M-ring protein/flagellar hook-basal body protein FliF [Pantoea sp. GM01]